MEVKQKEVGYDGLMLKEDHDEQPSELICEEVEAQKRDQAIAYILSSAKLSCKAMV